MTWLRVSSSGGIADAESVSLDVMGTGADGESKEVVCAMT
jgi:hypothetical protein